MANIPDPITRKDQYLSYLTGNTDYYPTDPITREEKYLFYLCENGGIGGGSVTPEQIQAAVDAYLEENPVSGMTEEQEEQLNQNTQDIQGKVDKNQGTSSSGKFLGIGADGNVSPMDPPQGATVEQVAQIEKNKNNISLISETVNNNKNNFEKNIEDIDAGVPESGLFDVDNMLNLLDTSKVKSGFISVSGSYSDYGGYSYTDFIPVEKFEKITLQSSIDNKRQICEIRVATKYGKNKEVIAESGEQNIEKVTINPDVCYVVLTFGSDLLEKEPAVYATDTVEPYKEYNTKVYSYKKPEIDLSECSFAELDNYYNKDSKDNVLGKYVYHGIEYENSIYFGSEYIEISPSTVYSFNKTVRYIECYDKDKLYIESTTEENKNQYTTSEGAYYIRFSGYISNVETITMVKGDIPKEEAKYEYYIPERNIMYDNKSTENILCFLPDEIVCAVGRTIEIYNSQVCPVSEKYHFMWNCQVGKALKRKFSITGEERLVGDYDLTLAIYNDDLNVTFSKKVKLKIVSQLSVQKTICPIGDSLTNGKYWLNEVRTLSENKISYIGTRGSSEGIKHEGRSGFSTDSYLTGIAYTYEDEGVPPFWNPGTKSFDWGHYKSTTGNNPDAVQIFLGTNDLIGSKEPEVFANNIKTMVDKIRENDSAIPIFLVMTILTGNQNGLGVQQSSDGFASQKGRFKYDCDVNIINGVKAMYELLNSETYTGVYFIPLTQCHDSEYNFGSDEVHVNPRATQTEFMPKEGIHPQKQGYEQFADVMYSVYSGVFK